MRRRWGAALTAVVLAGAAVTACSHEPAPPKGLPSCGAAPSSDGPQRADFDLTLEAPKKLAARRPLAATIRLSARSGERHFVGGIPVQLLVLARGQVVGTYRGPTDGTSLDQQVGSTPVVFPARGVITACNDTVGANTLPRGHYQLAATITYSVDGTTHQLVSAARRLQLTE